MKRRETMWMIVSKYGDGREKVEFCVEQWPCGARRTDAIREFVAWWHEGVVEKSWRQLKDIGYRCVRATVTWPGKKARAR